VARIIVVGAGMAGLAAAARLATRDDTVVLCEATGQVGGALGRWRHDDLSFDTGPHTLTLPAVYRDLFIKTGSRKKSAAATLEERVELRPLDPVRRYVFPDGTRLDLPNSSRGRLHAAFDAALGAGAGDAWLRVVDHGSRVWDAIRPTLVEAPGSGEPELRALLKTRDGRHALTPRHSLRRLAKDWFKGVDPRLLLVLDDYARQAGAEPRHAPGVLATRVYVEQVFGAWRIVGGLYELAEALRQRVEDRGVEVRLGARVARIERGPTGSVSGVLLEDGTRLEADVVVAGIDQAVLAGLLGGAPRAPKKNTYTSSVATLCFAVEEPPEPLHETVLLDEHGPAIRIHVSAEQPTAWTVHVPPALDTGAVLPKLAAYGIDVRAKARLLHVIGAEDWERATGVPGGAAYGPAADSVEAALLRSPIAQPIHGLYHVGASAQPGSGLPFVALSGWQASELVKRRLKSGPES
jgi:phytoene dehydrogenase-like protein